MTVMASRLTERDIVKRSIQTDRNSQKDEKTNSHCSFGHT